MSTRETAPHIRNATHADVDAITLLIEDSVRGLASDDYTREQIDGALVAAWGLDTQLIDDGTYFVIDKDGRINACGGWSFRQTLFGNDTEGNRNPARIDPATGAAKIRAFFVHPDFARAGLGSALMKHCETRAQAQGYKRLELMATLPGKRLYERHGFIGGTPIQYPLGPNLGIEFVPMQKSLTERHHD